MSGHLSAVQASCDQRAELLSWLNAHLPAHSRPYSNLSQLKDGIGYLHVLAAYAPHAVKWTEVNTKPTHEVQYVNNILILKRILKNVKMDHKCDSKTNTTNRSQHTRENISRE